MTKPQTYCPTQTKMNKENSLFCLYNQPPAHRLETYDKFHDSFKLNADGIPPQHIEKPKISDIIQESAPPPKSKKQRDISILEKQEMDPLRLRASNAKDTYVEKFKEDGINFSDQPRRKDFSVRKNCSKQTFDFHDWKEQHDAMKKEQGKEGQAVAKVEQKPVEVKQQEQKVK